MKKITSVITIIMLLVSFAVPAFASQTESEEMKKILLIVKERIGSTDEYEKFHSSVSTSGNSEIYNFRWESDKKSLNISANSDAVITSYYFYEADDDVYSVPERKPTLNKMTSSEALIKAGELIRILNPDIADDIRIINNNSSESLFDNGFSFSLQRTQNGVDVVGNTGYVRVDGNAQTIESFNLNYTQNLKFDNIASAIDSETAKELYKSKLGVKLQYNIGTNKAVLEYVPEHTDIYISAIGGETVNPVEPVAPMFKNEASADYVTTGGSGGSSHRLSESELKNVDELEGLISKNDGEAVLRNNTLLSIGSDMVLSYFNTYYDSTLKKYTYSYEFTTGDSTVSATLDASDATIKSYSYYNGKYEEVTDDNTGLAKSIVQQLAPGYYKADDTMSYRFTEAEKGTYTFVRYENNIPCANNGITLRLNSDNKISYYNLNHRDVEFDSPEGTLSESEACDKFFENCGYKMYYYPSCSDENLRFSDLATLIYDFEKHYLVIDAKTGELKNQGYEEPTVGNYTDIDGHYAEDVIKTLAGFGIGFAESEFKPDDYITQEDYIVLITSALIGNEGIVLTKSNTSYSAYFNRAVGNRIFVTAEEKAPKANVSREMAAVYMIRTLGLDEVASLENIYVSKFSDVSEHIGHISILNAMGVVSGFDSNFNPNGLLTRADAMIMLYNYLSR